MPPLYPCLKNDGPCCRVCGCSENNACPPTCSWVGTFGPDEGALCSACAGTPADLLEAMKRTRKMLGGSAQYKVKYADHVLGAAIARQEKRKKEVDAA